MIVVLIFILVIVLYCFSIKNHNYWSKRDVKYDSPTPLFGNHFRNLIGWKSITDISVALYRKYPKEQVVGYYRGRTPELILKDLDLIKQIQTVDFLYFYKRGQGCDPDREPLFANLFHVGGDKWRLLRQRLTPAFTVAKLKAMFPLVVRCAERLQNVVTELAERGETYDARELMARFTTEFIGACGFGIEMDTINTERSQFRDLGKMIFEDHYTFRFLFAIWELFPEIRNYVRVDDGQISEAIKVIVEQIRAQRNYKPIGRHDFIDLLLELESKGKIVGESIERVNSDGTPVPVEMEMDVTSQVAQVFIFFAAGFETSSSATSYCLHLLAFNQDKQRKVQEEIDIVLAKYDNKLHYDAIAEMTYLDMAFKETMRMFPSAGVINRICTRRYKIPELDITLDPGVRILIPVQAIHMDEKYYDNPTEFRPERFTPEQVKKRHNYSYLPFGEGPRACIAARLGQMQSLAGLAALLHKFNVEPATTSKRVPDTNPLSNVVQSVQGGLPLNFKPRTPGNKA